MPVLPPAAPPPILPPDKSVLGLGMVRRDQTALRLIARALPRSIPNSNVTFWPSFSPRKPADCTAEMCTNTSLPPSWGAIKPKPLVVLNHLTVPVAIARRHSLHYTPCACRADYGTTGFGKDWYAPVVKCAIPNQPKVGCDQIARRR